MQARQDGRRTFIYYCGDLDPSGWHASKDLEKRLRGFWGGISFERIGVLPAHIDTYQLQTRATKGSDTRTKGFYAELGSGHPSVELEAMHPDVLRGMVRSAIERHVDHDAVAQLKMVEQLERESLRNFQTGLAGGVQ